MQEANLAIFDPVDNLYRVYIQRVRCPRCGSLKRRTIRTIQNGDGTATRKTICCECELKYRVVVE